MDVFMSYNKALLTSRLILDASADSENENMVKGLKEVGIPGDYVNKLARIFHDVEIYEDPKHPV